MGSFSPLKNAGWSQGLYEVSSTQKEALGALRITEDGRKFRYGLAAGTLVAGGAVFGAADVDNHIAVVQTGYTNSLGASSVTVLVGATAVTANQYDEGYLVMYRGAAGTVGHYYKIISHTVSAAGSETITVLVKDPLHKATVATDYFSLYANPYKAIVAATDIATNYLGQAFVGMTTGQYGWFQTGGFGVCLGGDTATMGYPIGPSDTESSLEVASETQAGMIVGYAYAGNLVSGYYTSVYLTMD